LKHVVKWWIGFYFTSSQTQKMKMIYITFSGTELNIEIKYYLKIFYKQTDRAYWYNWWDNCDIRL